ncbi:hypothetical protein [Virgibacillus pantothenticus]|uniref:Uncharacterized protein n=1 Tax=Virgibacillus pantothenticus TaxID=1473 RepID=A0A0L0QM61_VIRPA|nr:hypothetical protein [Virgibacillus pantothenticus]KNE19646.1 hypothetical protein AFK71_14380 [Virgibacillus pantothenticus]MED3736653.1 hypothetical protein [Virgibacillus pantothenticus]QTY14826.1 hypothetical protein KBP50_12905 [Virgibacillus pantothenticus]SIS79197.1 hypothetical protein SAMN05421787_103246 [Virgibacillus pantothenticus]
MEIFPIKDKSLQLQLRNLTTRTSDEFDGGFYFISELIIQGENFYLKIKEIELNLRFYLEWLALCDNDPNVDELVSLDGRFESVVNKKNKHFTMNFIYSEIDYDELICIKMQFENDEIISFKKKLQKFIDCYN